MALRPSPRCTEEERGRDWINRGGVLNFLATARIQTFVKRFLQSMTAQGGRNPSQKHVRFFLFVLWISTLVCGCAAGVMVTLFRAELAAFLTNQKKLDDEVEYSVDVPEKIKTVVPEILYYTRYGECFHVSQYCKALESSSQISQKRLCQICARDVQEYSS